MADIAMLVAEESEKIKRGAPVAGEEASKGGGNFQGVAKEWGSWAESAAAAAGVKVHVSLLVKAEPKTPFALAAFDGFFSA